MFPSEIKDIRFKGDQAYVLKKMNCTSKMLENKLSSMSYSGQKKIKDKFVENLKLPPFVLSFYEFVFNFSNIPSEDEFLNTYINSNFIKTETGLNTKNFEENIVVPFEPLKGRVLRTYPSLIRDYHFYLKCTESKLFDSVTYSIKVDYFEGIDLVINNRGKKYYISLHVNTKRGNDFKKIKYRRHDYSNKNEVILDLDLSRDSYRVSNFLLYKDEIINELKEILEEDGRRK